MSKSLPMVLEVGRWKLEVKNWQIFIFNVKFWQNFSEIFIFKNL